ncbi:unnamed protein product [Haemonchus placei]|uniref:Decapping nuclease n=1 Tax=Haemonchus placei TaxID=6290 RepID=A0A0N4WIY3_HAEPC|nr:unnamed protein product [Haemonchus placei]
MQFEDVFGLDDILQPSCHYQVTRDRCVVTGREDAKYLYETALADSGRVRFDLNKGFDTFEEKEGDERLDVLLDWIATQAPRGGPLKKKYFALFRKESMTQRDKMMSYWGFKFEQYMTVTEKAGVPNVGEPVTCREEFAMVVKSTLAATSGRPLRLVYSGEVDAINKDGDPVELKTQRHALEGTFWKQKSMKWWLQSFLLGIRDIIVGYRDDDGIVKKVGFAHTDELPKRGEWSGNVCMNLLSNVLTSLRDLLEVDGEACLVRYEQNRDEITIHSVPLPDIDFFTYAFRVHFNLE